ncbi:MAG: hypothetical protein ACRET0_15370 [Steroidobacteraceae bacterium]
MLLFAALIVWRMYRRTRRLLVRQRLSPARCWVSVCLFPALLVLLMARAWMYPQAIAALVGGAAIGAALGAYALRRTTFERTAAGLFYRPSAPIGIGLSLLFAIRIIYRVSRLYALGPAAMSGFAAGARAGAGARPDTAAAIAASPITLAIFGMLAGYYVAYAIGLLLRHRQAQDDPAGGLVG